MKERKLKIAITTYPEQAQAEQIAKMLVQEKWAVCIQIDSPTTSIYRWKGEVECEKEVRVWMKCREALLRDLEQKVKQLHPYDTPQWVVIDVDQVSSEYLNWAYEDSDE